MHDVIIIGAGPAGLSAALWCDELGLDTIVLEQNEHSGGQLHSIYGAVENSSRPRALTTAANFLNVFQSAVVTPELTSGQTLKSKALT